MSVQIYYFQGSFMLKAAVSAFDLRKSRPVFPQVRRPTPPILALQEKFHTSTKSVCVIAVAFVFLSDCYKNARHTDRAALLSALCFCMADSQPPERTFTGNKMRLGQAALSQEMTERLK